MISPILTLLLCEMLPHIQHLCFLFKIPLFPSNFPPPVLYHAPPTLYTKGNFPWRFYAIHLLKKPFCVPREAERNWNPFACHIRCFPTELHITSSLFPPSVLPDAPAFCFLEGALLLLSGALAWLFCPFFTGKSPLCPWGTEFSRDACSLIPLGKVLHFLSGLSQYLVCISVVKFMECTVSCKIFTKL